LGETKERAGCLAGILPVSKEIAELNRQILAAEFSSKTRRKRR
jgi:hypothetical protein